MAHPHHVEGATKVEEEGPGTQASCLPTSVCSRLPLAPPKGCKLAPKGLNTQLANFLGLTVDHRCVLFGLHSVYKINMFKLGDFRLKPRFLTAFVRREYLAG